MFVLFCSHIYLYSICFAVKEHGMEKLKSVQILQEACLDN
jgi:hypothetical protein